MILPWKKLSERVEKVGWRTILHRIFLHPTGKEVECTIVDDGAGVVVFALTRQQKVVLCRHFRPGPERVMLELPAGAMEPDEDPLATAVRELAEETGYVGRAEYVGSFPFWSWGSGVRHVVLVRDAVRQGQQRLDGFEVIEPEEVSVEDYLELLRSGRTLHVGEAYAALRYAGFVRVPAFPPRRVAIGLLHDNEGRFLMQHRTDDAPRNPGRWGFFGGHVEPGEDPQQAVVREITEELGYPLKSPRLLLQVVLDQTECFVFAESYNPSFPLRLLEGQAMRWCSLSEAASLPLGDTDQVLLERLSPLWHNLVAAT